MQKQKKQMIVLVILLILLILAYIGVHFYSKKQEEKENAKEEAEKIQVTDLEVSDITQFSYVLDGTTLSFTKNGTEWTYDGDQSVDIDESALETLLNKRSRHQTRLQSMMTWQTLGWMILLIRLR